MFVTDFINKDLFAWVSGSNLLGITYSGKYFWNFKTGIQYVCC